MANGHGRVRRVTTQFREGFGRTHTIPLVGRYRDAETSEPDDWKMKEERLREHGAQILQRGYLVQLPAVRAEQLREDPDVEVLQRLWMGESVEEWDREPQTGSSGRFHVDRDVVNNQTWTTGTYLYDGSGNIKKIGGDTYWYDTAGRLIKAEVGGTLETYKYDSFGNLVERTTGGATAHFGPDPRTNRLAGESYDAAGAQLTRAGNGTYYSYDSVGSLMWISEEGYSGIGEEDFYLYTADDERIVTFQTEDEAFIRVRDLKNRVIREYFDYEADGWLEWQRDFVYAGDRLVSGEFLSMEGMRHYHRDHLGSTRLITDAEGVRSRGWTTTRSEWRRPRRCRRATCIRTR